MLCMVMELNARSAARIVGTALYRGLHNLRTLYADLYQQQSGRSTR